MSEAIVGVDVGGTFTDLVYMEPGGHVRIVKVPTTPADQSEGFMAALAEAGAELSAVANISHGTTTTTNATTTNTVTTSATAAAATTTTTTITAATTSPLTTTTVTTTYIVAQNHG